SRLAYRMFRHGHEVSGRYAGHPHRRSGSPLPASRKRDRAGRANHWEAVRPLLAARRAFERRFAEDVEVARQYLYSAGSEGARICTGGVALSARLGPVSQETEFHLRWPQGCIDLDRPAPELQAAPGDR